MATTEKHGEVIDFVSAQKKTTEKTTDAGKGEFPTHPAVYGYLVGAKLCPILKRLTAHNLGKVIGYAQALLAIQEDQEGAGDPDKPTAPDLTEVNNLKAIIREAQEVMRRAGKKVDYILPLYSLTFKLAQEIITSKNFEIVDIHTVQLDRKAITTIKDLRKQAEAVDEVCMKHDFSDMLPYYRIYKEGFSGSLLFKTSAVIRHILGA